MEPYGASEGERRRYGEWQRGPRHRRYPHDRAVRHGCGRNVDHYPARPLHPPAGGPHYHAAVSVPERRQRHRRLVAVGVDNRHIELVRARGGHLAAEAPVRVGGEGGDRPAGEVLDVDGASRYGRALRPRHGRLAVRVRDRRGHGARGRGRRRRHVHRRELRGEGRTHRPADEISYCGGDRDLVGARRLQQRVGTERDRSAPRRERQRTRYRCPALGQCHRARSDAGRIDRLGERDGHWGRERDVPRAVGGTDRHHRRRRRRDVEPKSRDPTRSDDVRHLRHEVARRTIERGHMHVAERRRKRVAPPGVGERGDAERVGPDEASR